MEGFIRSRIGRRFLAMFLVLILMAAAAGWLGMRGATVTIHKQTRAVLRAASDGAEAQLREFLLSVRRATEAAASDETVRASLSERGPARDLEKVLERLKKLLSEVDEVFCLDARGVVVAASSQGMVGQDFSRSNCFFRARVSFYPGDISREGEDGPLRWRMSAPIKGSEGAEGVLVVGLDPAALSALTTGRRVLDGGADTQSFRIGETGETYLVNREGFLITESRFAPHGILRVKVATRPVQVALKEHREILGDYQDYRGVPVSGASALMNEMGWVLITEIDFSQAFAPIVRLRRVLLGLAVALALAGALLAGRFAQRIVRPVRALSEADQALARGDETGAMVCEEWLPENEIGDLVRKRNERIRELMERQRELAREQKARIQAAAELERISYSMVHDMRAPLRAIITYGDLLLEDARPRLNEAELGYVERMRAACTRMDRLICDMLRYSSLLHKDVPLSAVNVSDLLREVLEHDSRFRDRRGEMEIMPQAPLVIGNRPVLMQCLTELLDNALKYGRPGVAPEVKVSCEEKGDWVRIVVEDNGPGMSKAFQARVFGIFQRGTSQAGGTGIGLAFVRVAVERMGGKVGVESEEGKGSRFWIELRRAV